MGAWIETDQDDWDIQPDTSRSVWARGLKRGLPIQKNRLCVALRVGAWIETFEYLLTGDDVGSRSVWARGLKLNQQWVEDNLYCFSWLRVTFLHCVDLFVNEEQVGVPVLGAMIIGSF